ncbi:cobyrinic acid a,c-diamide synthase [Bacillus sp. V3-13]|uniref:MinD/ParA family protein n=1 Tax=Bacillus sp. V3-13 TaxID=2053728 RepID=UPI000C78AFEC|nr:MinD/ParA family protein [Bacillus sp. V3-13]PLR77654.1 cobyrinic acid a,c-diamide synthase [Bacillus sp. V3-13]
MNDQAEMLRKRLKRHESGRTTKTIAVVSGKGGVGKSNFSLNFSVALAQTGMSVLVFDMDIGMGNLNILMGRSSDYTIVDYFSGRAGLAEIVSKGPEGVDYIAGGTGLSQVFKLEDDKVEKFVEDLTMVIDDYDYLLFDMGAGINEESLKFLRSVHEVFVVTTPEPTSITDAYSIMKYIHLLDSQIPLKVIVNRAFSEQEGLETQQRLMAVSRKFLGRELSTLGVVPDDRNVQLAVARQTPLLVYNEKAAAARAIKEIAKRHVNLGIDRPENSASKGFHFITRLKRFLFER